MHGLQQDRLQACMHALSDYRSETACLCWGSVHSWLVSVMLLPQQKTMCLSTILICRASGPIQDRQFLPAKT